MLPQTLFLHTLKVLNRILHSQSSQQGHSCESCSACSRETLVNHCAMPATRIQISNALKERRIWFYEAQKMIFVCYLFFEEKLHPKKIEKLQMKQNFQVAEWFSNSRILQQQKPLGSLLNPFFNFDYNNLLRHSKTCQTKMLRRRLATFDLGTKEGRMQSKIQYSHSAHPRPHSNIDYLGAHFPSLVVFLLSSL